MDPNPFRPHPELIAFDLDGTLVHTLPEITRSVNQIRSRYDANPLPEEDVARAIGDGASVLCQRTLGDLAGPGREIDELFLEFRAVYQVRSLEDPRFYPHAREFLEETAHHHRLAVYTNKPLIITEPLLERLGIDRLFVGVITPDNARSRKPDPEGLLDLLAALDVPAHEALHIGDSIKDFAAGRAAGVPTVGVRGGYYTPGEPEPDLWVENFGELRRLWAAARAP